MAQNIVAAPRDATLTGGGSTAGIANRAFWALCLRDLKVTFSTFPAFAAQVLLQPLFLLFTFGKVLPELSFTRAGYATLLLPGIIGLTTFLTGLQTTALPLVIEFSFSKEIEDRLLAPLSVAMIGVQKIFVAVIRSLIAGGVILPLGFLILSDLDLSAANIPYMIVVMVLCAIVGSGIGLTLGTVVQPNQINLIFSLALTPLIFTGCTYYPWPSLDKIAWFKVVTLFNPLTYAAEGLRAALVPSIAHMDTWAIFAGLIVSAIAFCVLGIRGFIGRAVD